MLQTGPYKRRIHGPVLNYDGIGTWRLSFASSSAIVEPDAKTAATASFTHTPRKGSGKMQVRTRLRRYAMRLNQSYTICSAQKAAWVNARSEGSPFRLILPSGQPFSGGVGCRLQERTRVPQRQPTPGFDIQCHSLRSVSIPQPVLEQFKFNLELCVSLIAAFT
jgi:hypothetical protein